jgi:hypothetical protein
MWLGLGRQGMHTEFYGETSWKFVHLANEEGDGRITLIIELRKAGCEVGRWMELNQCCVQWWGLILAVY